MEEFQSPTPPKVSAVVLSYNTAAYLRRCLGALEASAPPEQLEIIVADAGSLDESPRLDAEFPNVTFQRLPRNFGATKALNIGARTGAGDYIFFVDVDVEIEPGTAARLAAYLDANGDAAAVCPALFTPQGKAASEIHPIPTPDILRRAWHDPDALPSSVPGGESGPIAVQYPGRAALMLRKSDLRGINYLDEKYGQFWSDADLCYQILRAGKKIMFLPEVRATLHPSANLPLNASARGLLDADRASGAARYASKYFGFAAGLRLRIGAVLYALGQTLTFRDLGFQFARLSALLSGSKVDGTQTSL